MFPFFLMNWLLGAFTLMTASKLPYSIDKKILVFLLLKLSNKMERHLRKYKLLL